MPIWNVLEDAAFTLPLANPQQVKALQGRKSDQRDAKRIAEFLFPVNGFCWRWPRANHQRSR